MHLLRRLSDDGLGKRSKEEIAHDEGREGNSLSREGNYYF